MKKIMTALVTVFLLGCACALPANEEAAIKKVIPDALSAFGKFEFEKVWNYWCPDGFIEKSDKKQTVAEMKNSKKYKEILVLNTMKNAKNLEELGALLVKSGDMTPEQYNALKNLPDDEKKEMFSTMRQTIKMQQGMFQMALTGMVATLKYKELKIEGDTAVAAISLNGPLAGGGDAIVTFKKVKNAWKVYSVQEHLPKKETGKGAK